MELKLVWYEGWTGFMYLRGNQWLIAAVNFYTT